MARLPVSTYINYCGFIFQLDISSGSGDNKAEMAEKISLFLTWFAVDEPDAVDGEERLLRALPASFDVDRDGEGVDVAAVTRRVSLPSENYSGF